MDFTIERDTLSLGELLDLKAVNNVSNRDNEQNGRAIENSFATFAAKSEGRTVACARLLSDGALSFVIVDLLVCPEFGNTDVKDILFREIVAFADSVVGAAGKAEIDTVPEKTDCYPKTVAKPVNKAPREFLCVYAGPAFFQPQSQPVSRPLRKCFCEKCNVIVESSSRFCRDCGSKLKPIDVQSV